jgi:hypothetical protein
MSSDTDDASLSSLMSGDDRTERFPSTTTGVLVGRREILLRHGVIIPEIVKKAEVGVDDLRFLAFVH